VISDLFQLQILDSNQTLGNLILKINLSRIARPQNYPPWFEKYARMIRLDGQPLCRSEKSELTNQSSPINL